MKRRNGRSVGIDVHLERHGLAALRLSLPRPMTACEINRTADGKEPRVIARRSYCSRPSPPEGVPMSQKNRRSNREPKKPKQQKPKVAAPTSIFGTANANSAKPTIGKRK